jgi:hypothetical protein
MRKFNRVILAVAVLCITVSGPSVQATNDGDYYTTYYDSSQVPVGWHREDCDHNETWDGDQTGVWKEVTVYSCTTYGSTYQVYYACCGPSGGWRPVAYVGAT